jgi:hypothetical protein
MADPSLFDALRIPSDALAAIDNRTLHFAMPWHHVVRLGHVLSMAGFFGGIALLDLRLMRFGSAIPLKTVLDHVLPFEYAMLAMTVATGVALFLYDPVHVGSHAYFAPKLILMLLGLINALICNWFIYDDASNLRLGIPRAARLFGMTSLLLWLAVMVCASLNVETAPRLLLQ